MVVTDVKKSERLVVLQRSTQCASPFGAQAIKLKAQVLHRCQIQASSQSRSTTKMKHSNTQWDRLSFATKLKVYKELNRSWHSYLFRKLFQDKSISRIQVFNCNIFPTAAPMLSSNNCKWKLLKSWHSMSHMSRLALPIVTSIFLATFQALNTFHSSRTVFTPGCRRKNHRRKTFTIYSTLGLT